MIYYIIKHWHSCLLISLIKRQALSLTLSSISISYSLPAHVIGRQYFSDHKAKKEMLVWYCSVFVSFGVGLISCICFFFFTFRQHLLNFSLQFSTGVCSSEVLMYIIFIFFREGMPVAAWVMPALYITCSQTTQTLTKVFRHFLSPVCLCSHLVESCSCQSAVTWNDSSLTAAVALSTQWWQVTETQLWIVVLLHNDT